MPLPSGLGLPKQRFPIGNRGASPSLPPPVFLPRLCFASPPPGSKQARSRCGSTIPPPAFPTLQTSCSSVRSTKQHSFLTGLFYHLENWRHAWAYLATISATSSIIGALDPSTRFSADIVAMSSLRSFKRLTMALRLSGSVQPEAKDLSPYSEPRTGCFFTRVPVAAGIFGTTAFIWFACKTKTALFFGVLRPILCRGTFSSA